MVTAQRAERIRELPSVIRNTELLDETQNQDCVCQVSHGLSNSWNLKVDQEWQSFNGRLIDQIFENATDDDSIQKLVASCSIEDRNWSWSRKGLLCCSDRYEWFYLHNEDSIEGVCVIYHPKPSRLDEEEIFYVEFVAVAPWNRNNPFFEKALKGVGTNLLRIALEYSTNVLGYRPGFCLHSLPQAESYYERIGMYNFGRDEEKENLIYFEMDESTSASFI